jgi:hypothetical protein
LEVFEEWFIDQLQESNPVQLRRHLWNWREAVRAMKPEVSAEAPTYQQLSLSERDRDLLAHLATAGNVAVRYAQRAAFEWTADLAYEAFATVNRWGTAAGTTSSDWNVRSAEARCCVLDVVYALGAAALDSRLYDYLVPLADRRIKDDGYWEKRSWFRYSLTMAARADSREQTRWYIPTIRGRDFIAANDVLSKYFMSLEEAFDRVCQFDLFQCFFWYVRSGGSSGDRLDDSYPSCALAAPSHVAPLIRELISREGPSSLIGDYSNQDLADAITGYTQIARQSSGLMSYAGWADEGWTDEAISKFLAAARRAT